MIDSTTLYFFLVSSVVLAGFEQIYETFVLGLRKDKGEIRGEKWTIIGMGLIHILMFLGTLTEFFVTQKHLNLLVSLIGFGSYLIGVLLRYWSIHTLNRFWSIHIEIRENQQLIRNGPYHLMRHPAYLALFLKVPGVPLILNSYYTWLMVLITYCPLVLIRLYYEEVELFRKFKKSYVIYRKERWSIFPFSKGAHISRLANKMKGLNRVLSRW